MTQKVPVWVMNGDIIPIAFETNSTPHFQDALKCPYCNGTKLRVARTTRVGVEVLCIDCENGPSPRNPTRTLNFNERKGKVYLEWEK